MNNDQNLENLNQSLAEIKSSLEKTCEGQKRQPKAEIREEDENASSFDEPEIECEKVEEMAGSKGVIIADEPIRSALERMAETINLDQSTNLVIIEHALSGPRANCNGLNDAIELAKSGNPVIIAGWQTELAYSADPRWHAAMASPNVIFVRLPFLGQELITKVAEAKSNERPLDQLALDLLDLTTEISRAKTINHDLQNALRTGDEDKAETLLAAATELFGDQDREMLIHTVARAAFSEVVGKQFEGKYYPDLCIDLEGTLIGADGEPNQQVLDLIKLSTDLRRRPVTIWTGSELKQARQILNKLGLTCKLMSKNNTAGIEVETMIDDLSADEIESRYGIKARNYINIDDLVSENP
ncbi:MAG: hypothetical protein NTW50_01200 [Candidatus Berkelbacteria bacterium]|nr:hypothetical protein [Candidatus Berkelbacteria bacterium]